MGEHHITQEKINLFLDLSINFALYGYRLCFITFQNQMIPDDLGSNLGQLFHFIHGETKVQRGKVDF